MFSSTRHMLKKVFSHTMTRIMIVLLIPVIIVLIFALAINAYHISNYKSTIISSYSKDLNSFLNDTEERMLFLINSSSFVAENPNIKYALTTTDRPLQSEILPMITSLKQAVALDSIIDNVLIYNRPANFVVSSMGLYDANIYFDKIYPYNKYSSSYWNDYVFTIGSARYLAPTTINSSTSTETKTIVPLVFSPFGQGTSDNLIIFNINMNALFQKFETNKLTPNTEIYMKDNTTGKIYGDATFTENDTSNYDFISSVESVFQSNTDIVLKNGKKHLLIQSTDRFNMWGYTYFITVPYSDINHTATRVLLISCVFIFILFVIIMTFFFWGANFLYTPWRKLILATNSTYKPDNFSNNLDSGNIEDYIISILFDISDLNKNLQQNLDVTLPLSQEKYLIDILSDNVNVDNTTDVLKQLSFKYDYFAAIAIKTIINPDFFIKQEINISDGFMQKKIKKIFRSFFSSKFTTYELPGSNDILYLLLNLENDDCMDEIRAITDEIKSIVIHDNDNLEVVFGMGGIYKGFDGLKLTHREAVSSMVKNLNSSAIQFSSGNYEQYAFSSNSENVLTNYLVAGLTDKAKEFIDNIFANIQSQPTLSRYQIYSDVIIALRRIMRQKGMQSADSSTNYILEAIKNNTVATDEEIKVQIFDILELISTQMQTYSTKINIKEVILYISEHYAENIVLDELADRYNTSAKYLSKRIKEYLDMPFKDYTTQLKIEKAKELLENGDMSISEIYPKVGFQDRGTFTRAFKLKTGLAPSEYKKMYGNK